MKNFDQLFEELTDKALNRPVGSGTVAALDAGVHQIGKKRVRYGWPLSTRAMRR